MSSENMVGGGVIALSDGSLSLAMISNAEASF